MSSCLVERVCLHLKLVEDAVGENMNNYMLESGMCLQCNGDLSGIPDVIPMVSVG